jgi:hypothetical protein
VYGNAVAKNIVGGDTLYLTADTLLSVEDKEKKTRRMFAYNHVKIFKRDLQGKCDSLIYNYSDSTIYFYRDPVLWNERSQLTGDTINIQLANNKMDKMFLRTNAFVISLDSIKNYNQMKGRQMIAFFNKKEPDGPRECERQRRKHHVRAQRREHPAARGQQGGVQQHDPQIHRRQDQPGGVPQQARRPVYPAPRDRGAVDPPEGL